MPELDKKSPVCPDCLACGFPFWEQLTPEEQEFLCRTTRPVKYKKGERVHSPVENCVGILLLRTGQLRAYLLSEDGRDVTLYRLFPGEVCILSASCVMDSVNFDLYIDAEEDTEAYCIGAGNVPPPDAAECSRPLLCLPDDRGALLGYHVDDAANSVYERRPPPCHLPHRRAGQDRRQRCPHDPRPDGPLYGSAREVVSRLLKYFAQEGWVRLYRGGVEVLDQRKLQEIARGQ